MLLVGCGQAAAPRACPAAGPRHPWKLKSCAEGGPPFSPAVMTCATGGEQLQVGHPTSRPCESHHARPRRRAAALRTASPRQCGKRAPIVALIVSSWQVTGRCHGSARAGRRCKVLAATRGSTSSCTISLSSQGGNQCKTVKPQQHSVCSPAHGGGRPGWSAPHTARRAPPPRQTSAAPAPRPAGAAGPQNQVGHKMNDAKENDSIFVACACLHL